MTTLIVVQTQEQEHAFRNLPDTVVTTWTSALMSQRFDKIILVAFEFTDPQEMAYFSDWFNARAQTLLGPK